MSTINMMSQALFTVNHISNMTIIIIENVIYKQLSYLARNYFTKCMKNALNALSFSVTIIHFILKYVAYICLLCLPHTYKSHLLHTIVVFVE